MVTANHLLRMGPRLFLRRGLDSNFVEVYITGLMFYNGAEFQCLYSMVVTEHYFVLLLSLTLD